jgi:glycosyltransferase involved in cell wall biosynthesis
MPNRVVYYVGDYWPIKSGQYETYWKVPARNWITFFPKMVMKTFALREIASEKQPVIKFDHVIYPTKFMRAQLEQKGLSPKTSQIVYGGVDTSHYYCPGNSKTMRGRVDHLSLLYAGRLTQEKGVQTAIEALRVLVDEYGYRKVKLTIVGSGEPEFETLLHNLVRKAKITTYVNFIGNQSKEQMPAIYRQADVLLFTSIWPEPFGRVIVEAMVAGVAVVGTATGGAAEILMHEENSLIFEPSNYRQLAEKIIELINTPGLRERLVENGRRQALDKYDIRQMAGGIEEFLSELNGYR